MDHIEREHFKAIATNLGRIATVLEEIHADARAAKNIDVEQLIKDATSALRRANPAFDMAFNAVERQLLGPGGEV